MAKTQEALLSEVVQLLRKQNQLSTRDRLRESEEAKRQEKLTEVTTETQGTTATIVDSATDFQRRYLAGQAKTFTDRATGNAPSGARQELIYESLKNIKNILAGQMQFWEDLIDLGQQRNSLLMEEAKLDKKFRLNQIRNANEARLESINPQLAMAGGVGAGTLALPAPEEGDSEGSGFGSAFGASALTVAGLAVMKKLKNAFKFVFGLPKRIALGLRLVGMTIFSKFLNTKAGKPFMKNIGRVRAWPIILAAMVANTFFSGIKSAFADDQTGGNPHSDSADAEDQSMLDKVLDNKIFNTAMNAYLGFSVANFLSKGKLGATIGTVAITAWKGLKNSRLGFFLIRALGVAGGGAAIGLSAPAWAAVIGAGLVAYHWDSISSALTEALRSPTETELLDAAALVDGTFDEGLSGQDLMVDAMYDGENPILKAKARRAYKKILAADREIKTSRNFRNGLPIRSSVPDMFKLSNIDLAKAYTPLFPVEMDQEALNKNQGVLSDDLDNIIKNSQSLTYTGKDIQVTPFTPSITDRNFPMNAIDQAPVNIVAPQDNSQQNVEIKNYNTYEPTWGGATAEAYERHTTFGGNGAGNWF